MDRIFEAYNGIGGFSREFVRKSRERLHWTYSQVWGKKVLDVGCSQGVGPILLGRMGYEVLGIDVNPEAIAFAKAELEKESDDVRRRVQFECGDFNRFKKDEWSQVDAIVMGEVLEHLVRPADFINKAFRLLKPSGKLIVTVPFGINDDPDHRQTFYLTNIYTLLFPFFDITGVKFFGSWIGFIAKRREQKSEEQPQLPLSLFRQAEEAFYNVERPLRDEILNARAAIKRANDAAATAKSNVGNEVEVVETKVGELTTALEVEKNASRGYQEQIAVLKAMLQFVSGQQKPSEKNTVDEQRLLAYSQETRELKDENGALRDANSDLKTKLAVAEVECSHLSKELSKVEATVSAAERKAAEALEMAELYEAENDEARSKESSLVKAIETLSAEKQELELAKEELAERYAALEAQREQSQAAIVRIAGERTRLDQELAQLRLKLSESYSDAESLRSKLVSTEAASEEAIQTAETLKRDIARIKETNDALKLEVQQSNKREMLQKSSIAQSLAECESLKLSYAQVKAIADQVADLRAKEVREKDNFEQEKFAMESRIKKTTADYFKMKAWYESAKADAKRAKDAWVQKRRQAHSQLKTVLKAYDFLASSKLGRLTLFYWKLRNRREFARHSDVENIRVQLRKNIFKDCRTSWRLPNSMSLPDDAVCLRRIKDVKSYDISVVIPTYKPNKYLAQAVSSVLQQDFKGPIQILICINGGDKQYHRALLKQYAKFANIKVLLTATKGANAGRNLGIDHATGRYLMFLDDDDILTVGYINQLFARITSPDVNIVCGGSVNLEEGNLCVDPDTYINRAMSKLGEIETGDYGLLSCHLSLFWGKLYKADYFRKAFGRLREGEVHSEDVTFWADHFGDLRGKIALANVNQGEAYVRRVTKDSLSRPEGERQFAFYVSDRLKLMKHLSSILVDDSRSYSHKQFIITKIKAQTSIILRYLQGLSQELRSEAFAVIEKDENLFLNKSLLSTRNAIAFCHNFSPTIDASAFVATKRLREIDKIEGGTFNWQVISQDMSKLRSLDKIFNTFYAQFCFAKQHVVKTPFGFSPKAQENYVVGALKIAGGLPEPEIVYSRALFVGSHMAAYEYKKKHPNVKWYAEFSDPIAYGTDNQPRVCNDAPTWYDVEKMVYECADVIIFTNENQREFMLRYNPLKSLEDSIRRRSLVMRHPVLSHEVCNLMHADYKLPKDFINVGYFGTFYANRKCDDMLTLFENPKIALHVFTSKPEELFSLEKRFSGRLFVHPTISHLEFLNIGSKFDYLFLSDVEFVGEINPYLPSKYADYLTTGTEIIAKVDRGSVLSKEKNPLLNATSEITREFALRLKKKHV